MPQVPGPEGMKGTRKVRGARLQRPLENVMLHLELFSDAL